MDPPEDAIKTSTETIWVEDSIVIARMTGAPTTRATVRGAFAVYRDLTKGSPQPLLLDARKWPGSDAAAWAAAIENIESTLTAIAMLITPETVAQAGPFPDVIDRLMIPLRVFTDETEALAFLQGFLPKEQFVMEPPDDAIDAISSLVWMEDGIIIARATGAPSTPESVAQVFAAIRDVIGEGSRRPYLFDARNWPGGDVGVWTTAVAEMESTLTAQAMLVEPESSVGKGPFFLDRMPIPFRVFTDETEALAFLREFMPDE